MLSTGRKSRETGDRLKQLQKKLNKAIETEDFETAAQLRDEIKVMSGSGSGEDAVTRR